MKDINYLVALALFFWSLIPALAQDSSREATVVVIIPEGSTLSDVQGKGKPLLLFPTENAFLDKKNADFDNIEKLKFIFYDEQNQGYNKEFVFIDFANNPSPFIQFKGCNYIISEKNNKVGLAKMYDSDVTPGFDVEKFIKFKSTTEYGLPFNCKNHTPPDSYSNPNDIPDTCCFTVGCE